MSLTQAERTDAFVACGHAAMAQGQHDAAAAEFDLALALAPDRADLHVLRGRAAWLLDDPELALQLADDALRVDRAYAPAFALIGQVWTRLDFKTADAAFQEAIRLAPDDPQFRYDRLNFLSTRQRQPEALAAADHLLSMPMDKLKRPDAVAFERIRASFLTATRVLRGHLLRRMGRPDDAAAAFDQAVDEDPSALTFAERAAFRNDQNAPAELISADLDKSIALEPDYSPVREIKGNLHLDHGQYAAAEAEYARAIAIAPRNGRLHWLRATALRKLGRVEEAAETAAGVLDRDPCYINVKFPTLQERGYLPNDTGALTVAYVRDAVRACMIDEGCQ